MAGNIKWFGFKFMLLLVTSFLFFLGLMLMDYGSSLKCSGGFGQSLIFERIEPRVLYHLGLVFCTASYLIAVLLSVEELVNGIKELEKVIRDIRWEE